MAQARVTLMCGDCKHRARATSGDEYRRACDRCGGQLVKVKFGPSRRRRRG